MLVHGSFEPPSPYMRIWHEKIKWLVTSGNTFADPHHPCHCSSCPQLLWIVDAPYCLPIPRWHHMCHPTSIFLVIWAKFCSIFIQIWFHWLVNTTTYLPKFYEIHSFKCTLNFFSNPTTLLASIVGKIRSNQHFTSSSTSAPIVSAWCISEQHYVWSVLPPPLEQQNPINYDIR
jgi:hypothetical protein